MQILMHVVHRTEHAVECIRTLCMARMFWTKCHNRMPAVCYSTEMHDLGGSSCMVKMRPKLPLHGTAKE